MNKRLLGYALVILLMCGIALYVSFPIPPAEAPSIPSATTSSTVAVEGFETRTMTEGTALSLLRSYAREFDLTLEEKTYVGMGTLVEQIGGNKNGTDGKYWHYYINGKLAPVGADAYYVHNGDVIEWKFHAPSESL